GAKGSEWQLRPRARVWIRRARALIHLGRGARGERCVRTNTSTARNGGYRQGRGGTVRGRAIRLPPVPGDAQRVEARRNRGQPHHAVAQCHGRGRALSRSTATEPVP